LTFVCDSFYLSCFADHCYPHSFPTRRSSDLNAQGDIASLQTDVTGIKATLVSHEGDIHTLQADSKSLHDSMQDAQGDISTLKKRSEEHTSELQSRFDLVCRLLLEKKKSTMTT